MVDVEVNFRVLLSELKSMVCAVASGAACGFRSHARSLRAPPWLESGIDWYAVPQLSNVVSMCGCCGRRLRIPITRAVASGAAVLGSGAGW